MLSQVHRQVIVLIDTWWNVNIKCSEAISHTRSFNRYMVECEYMNRGAGDLRQARFNRYMVECELGKGALTSVKALVLIDTWWNVNLTKSDWRYMIHEF